MSAKNNSLKVGDKITLISDGEDSDLIGEKGKILNIFNKGKDCGIEMKNYVEGHSCEGLGRDGHCIYTKKHRIMTTENLNKIKQKNPIRKIKTIKIRKVVLDYMKNIIRGELEYTINFLLGGTDNSIIQHFPLKYNNIGCGDLDSITAHSIFKAIYLCNKTKLKPVGFAICRKYYSKDLCSYTIAKYEWSYRYPNSFCLTVTREDGIILELLYFGRFYPLKYKIIKG